MHLHLHMHLHMYIYIYILYIQIYVYICIYSCIYVYVCVYIYIYVCEILYGQGIICARKSRSHVHADEPHDHMYTHARSFAHADLDHMCTARSHVHASVLLCASPYDGLQCTSLFKLHPPALHQTMVSISLLYLNFPPPALHYTMVSMKLLYLKFPPPTLSNVASLFEL